MAELFGVAAGIIQIAGAGAKLSTALYNFTSSAVRADQEIRDIAGDVELTSNALSSVGEVFKTEDARSIVSKKAIQDANAIIKRCEEVFGEITEMVDKRRKVGEDGKKKVNFVGKIMWPMKEQRVELNRRRLESLKNSLVLFLHVLQLAQGQSRGNLERTAIEEERKTIRELHQRQQESLKSLLALESKFTNIALDDDETLRGSTESLPPPPPQAMLMAHVTSLPPLENRPTPKRENTITIDLSSKSDSDTSDSDATITDDEDTHLSIEELTKCAKHVQTLLKRITLLQQTFESTKKAKPHRKKHVHKIYRRFCRKFDSSIGVDRLIQRVDSSKKDIPSMPMMGIRSVHHSEAPADPQSVPSMFSTMEFGSPVLENFDFDSFEHVPSAGRDARKHTHNSQADSITAEQWFGAIDHEDDTIEPGVARKEDEVDKQGGNEDDVKAPSSSKDPSGIEQLPKTIGRTSKPLVPGHRMQSREVRVPKPVEMQDRSDLPVPSKWEELLFEFSRPRESHTSLHRAETNLQTTIPGQSQDHHLDMLMTHAQAQAQAVQGDQASQEMKDPPQASNALGQRWPPVYTSTESRRQLQPQQSGPQMQGSISQNQVESQSPMNLQMSTGMKHPPQTLGDPQLQRMLLEQENKMRLLEARQDIIDQSIATPRDSTTLMDYQARLKELEEQNKRRLLGARQDQDATGGAAQESPTNPQTLLPAPSPRDPGYTPTSGLAQSIKRGSTQEAEMENQMHFESQSQTLTRAGKKKAFRSATVFQEAQVSEDDETQIMELEAELEEELAGSESSFSLPSPQNNRANPYPAAFRSTAAEQRDYQSQLILLEQQNKKRLELARQGQQESSRTAKQTDYQSQLKLLGPQNKQRQEMAREEQEEASRKANQKDHDDYQSMLILLEEQNKKRLEMARQEREEATKRDQAAAETSSPPTSGGNDKFDVSEYNDMESYRFPVITEEGLRNPALERISTQYSQLRKLNSQTASTYSPSIASNYGNEGTMPASVNSERSWEPGDRLISGIEDDEEDEDDEGLVIEYPDKPRESFEQGRAQSKPILSDEQNEKRLELARQEQEESFQIHPWAAGTSTPSRIGEAAPATVHFKPSDLQTVAIEDEDEDELSELLTRELLEQEHADSSLILSDEEKQKKLEMATQEQQESSTGNQRSTETNSRPKSGEILSANVRTGRVQWSSRLRYPANKVKAAELIENTYEDSIMLDGEDKYDDEDGLVIDFGDMPSERGQDAQFSFETIQNQQLESLRAHSFSPDHTSESNKPEIAFNPAQELHIRTSDPNESSSDASSRPKPSRRKSIVDEVKEFGEAAGLGGVIGAVTGRSRSRSRHRHGYNRGYDSDRRRDSRSRSRSRGGRKSEKWEQAAKAAIVAGAVEAFRSRNVLGAWTGAKGQRVATAALGAAGIDGLINRDPEKHEKRHVAESANTGTTAAHPPRNLGPSIYDQFDNDDEMPMYEGEGVLEFSQGSVDARPTLPRLVVRKGTRHLSDDRTSDSGSNFDSSASIPLPLDDAEAAMTIPPTSQTANTSANPSVNPQPFSDLKPGTVAMGTKRSREEDDGALRKEEGLSGNYPSWIYEAGSPHIRTSSDASAMTKAPHSFSSFEEISAYPATYPAMQMNPEVASPSGFRPETVQTEMSGNKAVNALPRFKRPPRTQRLQGSDRRSGNSMSLYGFIGDSHEVLRLSSSNDDLVMTIPPTSQTADTSANPIVDPQPQYYNPRPQPFSDIKGGNGAMGAKRSRDDDDDRGGNTSYSSPYASIEADPDEEKRARDKYARKKKRWSRGPPPRADLIRRRMLVADGRPASLSDWKRRKTEDEEMDVEIEMGRRFVGDDVRRKSEEEEDIVDVLLSQWTVVKA
ncbi:hypothetical protein IQ07DRAFT_678787 [Pyrenochaeta sp. DS3sAY3a]|nr:hypothetical protein IQ07DRAFT_678787 [Pyrenochaeta sp. DS3sAY3a]